jgi:hypothetical protein
MQRNQQLLSEGLGSDREPTPVSEPDTDATLARYEGLIMTGYPACDGTYLVAMCDDQ